MNLNATKHARSRLLGIFGATAIVLLGALAVNAQTRVDSRENDVRAGKVRPVSNVKDGAVRNGEVTYSVLGETVVTDRQLSREELAEMERIIGTARRVEGSFEYTVGNRTVTTDHELSEAELVDLEGEAEADLNDELALQRPEPVERRLGGRERPQVSRNLQDMTAASELVFRGAVLDIEYRLSEPAGAEQYRVPYTFVTYRVDELMRGDIEGDTVTLRFLGGWNEETQHYMMASNVPQFDLDDEDILFVTGNTRRHCPLVGDLQGRLRIIDNRIFADSGHEVSLGKGGSLEVGAHHELDEVVSTEVVGRGLVIRSDDGIGGVAATRGTSDVAVNAATPDDILDFIAMKALPPGVGVPFKNADPEAPQPVLDLNPTAPPVDVDAD